MGPTPPQTKSPDRRRSERRRRRNRRAAANANFSLPSFFRRRRLLFSEFNDPAHPPSRRPNMATYSHSPLLDSTKFTNCVGYYLFQWFQNSLTCKKHLMPCCFNTIGEFVQYSVFSSPPQRRRRGGDVRLGRSAYAAASSAFSLSPPPSPSSFLGVNLQLLILSCFPISRVLLGSVPCMMRVLFGM